MKKHKYFSLLMSVVIILASFCSPVTASNTLQQSSDAVIDTELRNILLISEATDQIPVDIWLYDPVSSEELEKAISSRIGMTREQLTTSKDRSVTAEKVDTYIETERTLYAEKMNQHYDKLLKDYSNVKALCETREGKRLFFSQYAPMISAELTPKEIKQLAADSRVVSICYSPRVEMVNESDISLPTIGANYTRDTLRYTGSGIKIGLLEADFLPNKNSGYFTANNIEYDPDVTVRYGAHANQVAAIMVAKTTTLNGVTYKGIVPDAELYATYYESGNDSDWRARVEWLLSENVHVINMSAGISTLPSGTYGTLERWLDHVAINHSVHFVKSAGNNGNKITSPGMAYNIITVGAIDDNNNTTYSDDSLTQYSSWDETSGTNKPDLVAPGTNITTAAGTNSGTSFAAPHVTAVVAQLCQRKPELKLLQDTVKAILTASVSHSDIRYNTMDGDAMRNQVNDNYNQCGAGVVNARSACSTIINSRYASGSFAANSGDGTQVKYTFEVTNTNRNVRVALSWLKCSVFAEGEDHESGDLTAGTLADLNLYIYDSEGKVVYQSKDVESNKRYVNTEIVEFKPTRTGTHRIYVRQSTQSNKRVYYGVAWWHPTSN